MNLDPYGNSFIEPGKCPECGSPECGSPEIKGGMGAGSYIPFKCGASRRVRGCNRDGWLSYDTSTGAICPMFSQGVCDFACMPHEVDPECDYHNHREIISKYNPNECKHDWKPHSQPIPVLRVCGWKCTLCGEGTITNPLMS